MDTATLDQLKSAAEEKGFVAGADVGARYYTDARGEGAVTPALVLRPDSTETLSRLMAICHAAQQPVVVQGGMTGLVRAAVPQQGEVVISMERMNRIETLDEQGRTMTVQAGTPLQVIQERADAHGLVFPLDLGARGSCTIGGNLSTNAGGNRVVRFGMTRDLTLGVEAVLADGTVISSLTGFLKNNTGYDLKQLFIGSEGTLGLITRATLRLFPKPQSQIVAFCAVDSFDAVVDFMAHVQSGLGADLSAFEVVWSFTYDAIVSQVAGIKAPLETGHAFYVLVEMMGSSPALDQEKFETVLRRALEKGMIADAVLSQSEAEVTALWDIRDGMAQAMRQQHPAAGFDISLSVANMKDLEGRLLARLRREIGDPLLFIGGHLADGNLHLMAKSLRPGDQPVADIESIVYGLVGELGGSISAEHGIGMVKRAHLGQSRTPAELTLMRSLKQTLDPLNLLNPGRVFTPGSAG
ncbi:FAD-binding oxidoreductase [Arenibacterium sp. CAU 1754]